MELNREIQTLLYDDGLVIQTTVTNVAEVTLLRSAGTARTLPDLKGALAANRVARQLGFCDLGVPTSDTDRLSVTWFGRGRRNHSFTTGQSYDVQCPQSTKSIVAAIERHVESARLAAGAELESFQYVP
jgi:hypothetical protein